MYFVIQGIFSLGRVVYHILGVGVRIPCSTIGKLHAFGFHFLHSFSDGVGNGGVFIPGDHRGHFFFCGVIHGFHGGLNERTVNLQSALPEALFNIGQLLAALALAYQLFG